MVYSTIAYIIWQILYYVFIIVRRREKVESGLRITSYSWLLNDSNGRKGMIQKLSFAFGAAYKIHMFMLLQLVYSVLTVVPTYFLYQHFWLHTLFLCSIFTASVFNGASYYIEVFSRRYVREVESVVQKSTSAEGVISGENKSKTT